MSTLHIVNKTGQPLSLCLRSLGVNDAIIFIEDGVYNLLSPSAGLADISQAVYALANDCEARGVLPDGMINRITMEEFVVLTEHHPKTLSWF